MGRDIIAFDFNFVDCVSLVRIYDKNKKERLLADAE